MSKILTETLKYGCASAIALAAMSGTTFAQTTKTIQVAGHYSAEEAAPLLECFGKYEAQNPGIKVEYQQASYADFLQTILTSRVGGTSPDVYNVYSIWTPQLAAAGTLDTLPADIVEFVNSNYTANTVDAATIGGELRGIPTELSVYNMIYNKKLLQEAGHSEPPKTWDELKAIAAKITKKNEQGNITTGGYAFGPTVANAVHVFYSQMYAAGVPPFAADGRSTNLTSPEAVRILEQHAALFKEGITSTSIATRDFPAGAVGMMIGANWQKSTLESAFGAEFPNTVGVAPIPTDGPGGTMFYTFLWAVDSTSDVKRESWDFLKWLNTAQAGGDLSCTGAMLAKMGALTGNKADLAAMGDSIRDGFSGPYVAAIESGAAKSQPNIWQAAEVDRLLRSYIEKVWAGDLSAADALAQADEEIQAILDEQP